MSDVVYTQQRPGFRANWDQINKFISEGNQRMAQQVAANARAKAAKDKAKADELRDLKSNSAKMLKRLDGYDSSILAPPLRPFFEQYKNEQLEAVDYFRIDDPKAVEQAITNIGTWLQTHSEHTQNQAVVAASEMALNLAGDEAERIKYAEGISPLSQAKIDLPTYANMELYHSTNFGRDFTMQDGVVYGIELDKDGNPVNDTPVPVTQFGNWGRAEDYEIPIGTKATKSLQEFAIDFVRPETEGYNNKEWDRGKARETATTLVTRSLTEEGKGARRRIIEDFWPETMMSNSELVEAYINLDRDNFHLQERASSIDGFDMAAIGRITEFSKWVKPEDEKGPGNKAGKTGMTEEEAKAEVFGTNMKFDTVGDYEAVYGTDKELMLGDFADDPELGGRVKNQPLGSYFNLERLRMKNYTLDIPNPLYEEQVEYDANGERIEPDGIDPVIKVNPNDLTIVTHDDGTYQVVIQNLYVKGSPYSAVMLDGKQDYDTLAQLDFYLKEAYNGHITLADMVAEANAERERFFSSDNIREALIEMLGEVDGGEAVGPPAPPPAANNDGPLSRWNTGNN